MNNVWKTIFCMLNCPNPWIQAYDWWNCDHWATFLSSKIYNTSYLYFVESTLGVPVRADKILSDLKKLGTIMNFSSTFWTHTQQFLYFYCPNPIFTRIQHCLNYLTEKNRYRTSISYLNFSIVRFIQSQFNSNSNFYQC